MIYFEEKELDNSFISKMNSNVEGSTTGSFKPSRPSFKSKGRDTSDFTLDEN